jgi:cyclic di-GMP phosphodiesterase Gmr
LHQNADIAMYRVKNDTKGAAVFFDAGMESEALARMATEQALRLAILDKRFCCAFQPKVDIRTKEIQGIEALVRLRRRQRRDPGAWRLHQPRSRARPDRRTDPSGAGRDHEVDRPDRRDLRRWRQHQHQCCRQAGRQCRNSCIPFAKAIAGYRLPDPLHGRGDRGCLSSPRRISRTISCRCCARLGVGVSIDDFGVGYSSLSALADITADEIKIDRSFITDIHKRPRSQGILRAIESLSEALGMTVIAEGVETFEELAYLQAATKIRYAQGYYFSKPIFLEELQPQARTSSDLRGASSARPAADARPAYSRSGGRGY